jgi:hypothetical protein
MIVSSSTDEGTAAERTDPQTPQIATTRREFPVGSVGSRNDQRCRIAVAVDSALVMCGMAIV